MGSSIKRLGSVGIWEITGFSRSDYGLFGLARAEVVRRRSASLLPDTPRGSPTPTTHPDAARPAPQPRRRRLMSQPRLVMCTGSVVTQGLVYSRDTRRTQTASVRSLGDPKCWDVAHRAGAANVTNPLVSWAHGGDDLKCFLENIGGPTRTIPFVGPR
jgi:hypothetical protein